MSGMGESVSLNRILIVENPFRPGKGLSISQGFNKTSDLSVASMVRSLDNALTEVSTFNPQVVLFDMDSLRRNDALAVALGMRREYQNLAIIFMSERDMSAMAKEGMVSALYHHAYWLRQPSREPTIVLHEIYRALAGANQLSESLLEDALSESHHQGLLSPQQHRVMRLMASGLSNSAIGYECHISTKAVERTIAKASKLLGVPSASPIINPRVMAVMTYLKVMSFM